MSAAPQVMGGSRQSDGGPFGFMSRSWAGQADLGTVFWGFGVLGNAMLGALYWLLMAQGNLLGQQVLLLLLAVYTVWLLGSIWRCARRVDADYFHRSARALSLAWGINALLLGGFLEVDLLGRLFS